MKWRFVYISESSQVVKYLDKLSSKSVKHSDIKVVDKGVYYYYYEYVSEE